MGSFAGRAGGATQSAPALAASPHSDGSASRQARRRESISARLAARHIMSVTTPIGPWAKPWAMAVATARAELRDGRPEEVDDQATQVRLGVEHTDEGRHFGRYR